MLDYKLIDGKLVEQIVEAIRSGNVSIIKDRFVVAVGADLAALSEYVRLRIIGGNVVVALPEADEIREALQGDD